MATFTRTETDLLGSFASPAARAPQRRSIDILVTPSSPINLAAHIERSGSTLVVRAYDANGAALPLTGFNPAGATLAVGGVVTALSRWLWNIAKGPEMPYATCFLDVPVKPGDAPVLNAPAGLITTAIGPSPTAVGLVIDNQAGSVPTIPADRKMGVAWNLLPPSNGLPIYGNLLKGAQNEYFGPDLHPTLTADLYPISDHVVEWKYGIGFGGGDPATGKGLPFYPTSGISALGWAGSPGGRVSLISGPGTAITVLSVDSGHATGNKLTFEAVLDGSGQSPAPCFAVSLAIGREIIDASDAGRTAYAGTWTPMAGGWSTHAQKAAPGPNVKATYLVGNLPAGTWSPRHHWTADPGNTKLATVVVKEAGVVLVTYYCDQTRASCCAQANDPNMKLSLFTAGSAFTSSGGPITIEITGNPDGNLVNDGVWLELQGSLAAPIAPFSDVSLIPPGIDPANAPKFHPSFLSATAGAAAFRDMQLNSVADAKCEIADYATPLQISYAGGMRRNYYAVTRIETWTNPNHFWETNKPTTALFTVEPIHGAPLPLAQGAPVSEPPNLDIAYVTGGMSHASNQWGIIERDTTRMKANQFAQVIDIGSGSGTLIPLVPTSPATSLGTAYTDFVSIPPADRYDLDVAVGTQATWQNVPLWASTACVTSFANLHAAKRPKGTPVILEGGNECWNTGGNGYPGYPYCYGIGASLGISEDQAYAHISAGLHDVAEAALAAQGRGDELLRVLNVPIADTGRGQAAIDYYWGTMGKPVDLIAVTGYITAQPVDAPGLDAVSSSATFAQCVDLCRAQLFHGPLLGWWRQWKAIADAQAAKQGKPCRVVFYEAGIASLAVGGDATTQGRQSLYPRYHPLVYPLMIDLFSAGESLGAYLMCLFNLTEPPVRENGPNVTADYGACLSYAPVAGKGDGSDGLIDNRKMLDAGTLDLTKAVVPILAAVRDWNAATPVPPAYTVTSAIDPSGAATVKLTGPNNPVGTTLVIKLGGA